MRQAVESKDYPTILRVLAERCEKVASGCWEWQGVVDSRGYGRVGFHRAGRACLIAWRLKPSCASRLESLWLTMSTRTRGARIRITWNR